MSETTLYQVYNSNAALMPSAADNLDYAKAIAGSVLHNFGAPAFLLVEGRSDWALRFDSEKPTELTASEIPHEIRRANERD